MCTPTPWNSGFSLSGAASTETRFRRRFTSAVGLTSHRVRAAIRGGQVKPNINERIGCSSPTCQISVIKTTANDKADSNPQMGDLRPNTWQWRDATDGKQQEGAESSAAKLYGKPFKLSHSGV